MENCRAVIPALLLFQVQQCGGVSWAPVSRSTAGNRLQPQGWHSIVFAPALSLQNVISPQKKAWEQPGVGSSAVDQGSLRDHRVLRAHPYCLAAAPQGRAPRSSPGTPGCPQCCHFCQPRVAGQTSALPSETPQPVQFTRVYTASAFG